MGAIYEQYTEEMHREFGYSATWLPNVQLRLGDVGLFRRDRFERVTSLPELGVAFDISEIGDPSDLEYSSAGQVEISYRGGLGVATPAIGDGHGTISVRFLRAHAILFQALGCRVRAVSDLAKLGSILATLMDNGTWRPEHAVITEIVETKSAAVLVSNQANARVDFRVDAVGPAGPLALAYAAGHPKIAAASGIAVRVIAPDGLTPLFRAAAFKSRIRRSKGLTYRGGSPAAGPPARNDLDFAALSYADVPD